MLDKIIEWEPQRDEAQQEEHTTAEDQPQRACGDPLPKSEVQAWADEIARHTPGDDAANTSPEPR
jgi:hypothetical protein